MSRVADVVRHHRTVKPEIVVPAHCLVVLIGAAGSGKSTFAGRWFTVSEILSSDAFRARVGRREDDLAATGRAFALLHRVLSERLAGGGSVVVDATNIRSVDRVALVRRASAAHVPALAIVLDLTLEECLDGDRQRVGRHVPADAIASQWTSLRAALEEPRPFAGEGFAAVHRLVGHNARDSAVVRREQVG